jgi:formamidopyrimidine-DNA glycosylase
MIELPEAVVLARQMNETVNGKEIAHALANTAPHKFAWYTGDPASYSDLLAGKPIGHAAAYGNHVEIEAGDKVLVLSTPIRYHTEGEKPPQKHQLLLQCSDRTALSCTVQMWGAILCLDADREGGMPDYQIARQKPSPLSEAFDRAYFDALCDDDTARLSAKAFLATQQRIPGLGNGVLQDILWTARIHPRCKMGELSASEIDGVFQAVKQVLAVMTEQGGRDTERDLFGRPGGYKTVLSKNTVGRPCPACGTAIEKETYLGGTIYYCSGCQRH